MEACWRSSSGKSRAKRPGLGQRHAKRKTRNTKKEGDLRSPAGIFRFESAFGYAPAEEVNFKLNYIPVTDANICVEDSHSKYYNQIVDINKVEQDWADSESMLRKDEQYKWGIFVKQNVPAEADCGSCIFPPMEETGSRNTGLHRHDRGEHVGTVALAGSCEKTITVANDGETLSGVCTSGGIAEDLSG